MKKLSVLLLISMLSISLLHGKDFLLPVDGKDIKMSCTIINHEITAKDKEIDKNDSAVNSSYLFYSLLATNDIKKASQLSTNPQKARDKWTKYSGRLGTDEFKKSMSGYFTDKFIIIAEIVNGSEHMLVVQPPEGKEFSSIQVYQKQGDLFVIDDNLSQENQEILGKLLPMIQEGTLKLEQY